MMGKIASVFDKKGEGEKYLKIFLKFPKPLSFLLQM